MRAAIIDNESKVRELLKALLVTYCPSVELVGEADSMQTGIQLILREDPDLVFLDIELGDGTGIELYQTFKTFPARVIFITAHDKYAIDAFKCSALDFLLKPIDPEELVSAIKKAGTLEMIKSLERQVAVLKSHLGATNDQALKIVLSDSESIHIVPIDNIMWCCAEGSYTKFVLSQGRDILVSKNLKAYEDMLDSDKFLRIHHSYLVNVSHIKRFEKSEGGVLVMDNDSILPVSVRKKDNLMQLLKNWNRNTVVK